MKSPRCIIIAGPNGAGKTTFAREFLPKDAGVVHFVNADLLAAGLSPLKPDLAALNAGRLFLAELDRLAKAREDFAFESTLSGLTYIGRLKRWKAAGYQIGIFFLKLTSIQLALRRIAVRVRQGGHNVPPGDVERRFKRGWKNFEHSYKPLADSWEVYDNSGSGPELLEAKVEKNKNNKVHAKTPLTPAGRALQRAALAARKTARMYGTPIYIWRDGKVVAEKP